MVNSVHTNVAAIVALQGLNRTNEELQGVQNRVSTGYRINNAQDDGAAFAIAQGLRGNVKHTNSSANKCRKQKGCCRLPMKARNKFPIRWAKFAPSSLNWPTPTSPVRNARSMQRVQRVENRNSKLHQQLDL